MSEKRSRSPEDFSEISENVCVKPGWPAIPIQALPKLWPATSGAVVPLPFSAAPILLPLRRWWTRWLLCRGSAHECLNFLKSEHAIFVGVHCLEYSFVSSLKLL
jgi:hypothetical protein